MVNTKISCYYIKIKNFLPNTLYPALNLKEFYHKLTDHNYKSSNPFVDEAFNEFIRIKSIIDIISIKICNYCKNSNDKNMLDFDQCTNSDLTKVVDEIFMSIHLNEYRYLNVEIFKKFFFVKILYEREVVKEFVVILNSLLFDTLENNEVLGFYQLMFDVIVKSKIKEIQYDIEKENITEGSDSIKNNTEYNSKADPSKNTINNRSSINNNQINNNLKLKTKNVNRNTAIKEAKGILSTFNANLFCEEKPKNYAYLFFKDHPFISDELFLNFVKISPDRLIFLSTILGFVKDFTKFESFFYESIDIYYNGILNSNTNDQEENKNVRQLKKIGISISHTEKDLYINIKAGSLIVNAFIKYDVRYNEIVINKLLDQFNILLYKDVLDNSKPEFNFLFIKRLLSILHSTTNNENANKYTSNTHKNINIHPVDKTKNAHNEFICNIPDKESTKIDVNILIKKLKLDTVYLANYCFSYIIPRLSVSRIHKSIGIPLQKLILEAYIQFSERLSNSNYEIVVPLPFKLREYQIKGVAWISFLYEYGVNGILADDMGLGKTIMVLSFISNEIYKICNDSKSNSNCSSNIVNEKSELKYDVINNIIQCQNNTHNNGTVPAFRTLILTPNSLTGHWEDEINSKFNNKACKLDCQVFTKESILENKTITISSFETFKKYTEKFDTKWHYLIIDEGHLIRNRDSLTYKKIQTLKADHKLILTGTPINNSVQDIFSLFNILMPNYLGTEKEFQNWKR
ncbi:hypothetical protein EDEG_01332 [Edhazardia aedis USNM 41457]|uniref:Helicase ATP-binding domain-containing protein n=1 Tax=Edhazardia aedis (strain USNM 41457) TaxID=1003232 RepID=J9DT24_EDHAE|nr:hypothetical protein EDEG_01332 [Edhazardia aedis USNM 41457]|eukprot:EJW04462.1 hypothetical protein EDEG_01332 [Edhazardia aedis USNM 41457]